MNAGSHTVTWNAQKFASGIYYYRIEHEKGKALTKKMLLLK